MVFITSDSNSPSYNLAWEEYILKYLYDGEDIFLLWQNDSSLIIGRNQNVYEEANMLYLKENQIPLFRRNSGGGCVYHDLGNINFTFITQAKGNVNQYEKLLTPIINALNTLHINATFHPKSDLYLEGKKIGGNAQYLFKDVLLHHGTILFNTDLDTLNNALAKKEHIKSTSIKSRRASVINISNYTKLDIHTFMGKLKENISPKYRYLSLTDEDKKIIQQIEREKYLTDEWNYFESPKSSIHIKNNDYTILIEIDKGHIKEIFIENKQMRQTHLEKELINKPFLIDSFLFLKTNNKDIFHLIF
ncbi:MAG: biotin/lipoate A/B protein ligase family protein [Acholeplasmataceae bacterium]